MSVSLPACVSVRLCVEMCAGCSPSQGYSIPSHSLPLFTVSVSRALFRALAALISSGPFPASSPHFPLLGLALPVSLVSSPFHLSGLRPLAGEPSASVPGPSFAPLLCFLPSLLPVPPCWLVLDAVSLFLPRTLLPPPDPRSGPLWPAQSSSRVSQAPLLPLPLTPFTVHHCSPRSPRPPLSSSWALISAQMFFPCPVCPPLLFMTTCFPLSCVPESEFPSPIRGALFLRPPIL